MAFEAFRSHVADVLDDLLARRFFEEAFGYDCPDRGGTVAGTHGSNLRLYIDVHLGLNPLPFRTMVPTLEADELFDLIETIYPIISKPDPRTGTFHRYCGQTHDREFSTQPGRQELREAVNPVMARLDTPLELLEDGYVVERASDGLGELISAPLPPGTGQQDVGDPVVNAVKRYLRARGAPADRRAAIVELAGVLEYLRPQIQTHMFEKDEAALFTIANNFSIRHKDRMQKTDYDADTWLPWMFHIYLATIHAVTRAIANQAQPREPAKP